MPDHTIEDKTLPRLSMQVILKKIKEVTRIRPDVTHRVSVERIYFGDSGPGGGYYDFNDAGDLKVTGASRATSDSVSTIVVAAITGDQDLRFVRAQYTLPGSINPMPLGYGERSKTGGGVHILKVFKEGGNLKVRVYNDGPVDVDVRIFYSGEAST